MAAVATNTMFNKFSGGDRLLADIGSTNVRFARQTQPAHFEQIRHYPSNLYRSLEEAVLAYYADCDAERVAGEPPACKVIRHAAVAIANPIDGDRVRMTNRDWSFSIEATRRKLGLETLLVVNDFTALAMGLPHLSEAHRVQIGGGSPRQNGVIGLIGAGTGLGVSGLIPAEDRWIALGSEGGHASFSPSDEFEIALLQHAWKTYPHVSVERLAAGPGLRLVYEVVCEQAGKAAEAWDTAEIVAHAIGGDHPGCAEAVDRYCAMLGTFAGNVAVTFGALGGIYIGGGVVPRLGNLFARSSFRQRFEHKGRFNAYLQQVPTFVITAETPALYGAAAILAEQLREHANNGLLDRIRQARHTLSPAERQVADLVLEHPRAALNDPVADLARKANVSQPTVIRFCRSLGYQGLSDFKLKLSAGLTGTIPIRHSEVHAGDTTNDFGAKVLNNAVSAFIRLRERLDFPGIERAIELIDRARSVAVYGFGTSTSVAQDAYVKLLSLGIPTNAYNDPHLQSLSINLLRAEDVVVIISRSGCTPPVLEMAEAVLQTGASVVAITVRGSPLASLATVTLDTDPLEAEHCDMSMIARMRHLAIVDIIAVGVAMRRGRVLSK